MDSAASHLCVYCSPLDIVLEYLHCTRVNDSGFVQCEAAEIQLRGQLVDVANLMSERLDLYEFCIDSKSKRKAKETCCG
ncbi:hypothetical protein G1ANC_00079 [Candidatus Nanosynsacchari sp. TM7_ANC_38.39_G1_1]|nr:hypothetical protein G1ANC_00079 [Candidatus Nanosynsacchari sp. TM7_ANC_38.39_G1_1]